MMSKEAMKSQTLTLLDDMYRLGYVEGYEKGTKDRDEQLTKDERYNKGLEDAWACARRIVYPADGLPNKKGLLEKNGEIFNNGSSEVRFIFKDFSASEAIAKIEEYDRKLIGEIEIGDEIEDGVANAIVIGIKEDGTYSGLDVDSGEILHIARVYKKTGRHFSNAEIVEIAKKCKDTLPMAMGCRKYPPFFAYAKENNIYECSCGYGWDWNKVTRHHFCPNCGKAVEI